MIALIVTIALVGLIVWLITTYIPMPPGYKRAIQIIALVCVILFVLKAFGLFEHAHDIPVPKL